MDVRAQVQNYNGLSKVLHWSTALIVLGLLSVGFYMTSMEFSPLKLNIYMLHKSFGMTVLGLVVLRILWRIFVRTPKPLDTHARWEKTLSKIIHFLLHYGLIAMPMSGWAMSSAAEYPVNFFGLYEFPAITEKNEETYNFLKFIHESGAYALIVAIGLHFLGTAKHHIIDKDRTLARMGGNMAFLLIGGLMLLSASLLAGNTRLQDLSRENLAQEAAQAPSAEQQQQNAQDIGKTDRWIIDPALSAINFQFTQYGKAVNGSFGEFKGEIIFNSDNLDESHARIEISIASIKTGSEDRDAQARGNEWFDAEEYPQAVFETESFSESGANQYLAQGHLVIRDQNMPVELPFTLEIHNKSEKPDTAEMSAEITLNRQDYGIGQGQWESEEAIENKVKIYISVFAARAE